MKRSQVGPSTEKTGPSRKQVKTYLSYSTPSVLRLQLQPAISLQRVNLNSLSYFDPIQRIKTWLQVSKNKGLCVPSDKQKANISSILRVLCDDHIAGKVRTNFSSATVRCDRSNEEILLVKVPEDATVHFEVELVAVQTFIYGLFKKEPSPSILHLLYFLKDEPTFRKFSNFVINHTAVWSYPKMLCTIAQISQFYKAEPKIQETLSSCASIPGDGIWYNTLSEKLDELEKANEYDPTISMLMTPETEWLRVIGAFKNVLRHDRKFHHEGRNKYYIEEAIGLMIYFRNVAFHFSDEIEPEVSVTQVMQLMECLFPTYLSDFAFRLYMKDIKLYNRFFVDSNLDVVSS